MGEKLKDDIEPAVKELNISVVDVEEGFPKYSRKTRRSRLASNFRKAFDFKNRSDLSPWPQLIRRLIYLFSAALLLAIFAVIIYHSLLLALVRRLSPPRPSINGLTQIVAEWAEPGVNSTSPSWLPNFSRDVVPKEIHSHNDYWRRVPLFDALSLGITGVEADCHLVNGELFVGHTNSSLRPNLTLRSLYLDPLTDILTNQNAGSSVASSSGINGVWDTHPSRGIVLMTDLKTEGFSTLEAVQAQLESFRQKGWLTYWNGTDVIPGPITHVGTGNTPFEAVLNSSYSNSTYRDVFFDAPLNGLSEIYNISNSYYTSASLTGVLGGLSKIPRDGLSKKQMIFLQGQVNQAAELGLASRYWDIPAWPVSRRINIWHQLEELGIGMLNADAIDEAARWDWRWCNILGLELC
ncbi:hypothetical protein N431DRAFT_438399 [Stipitochalara longipes BDJ]|nr:hypothetical protein N431DRAFT_438399 [Stipitochalara longipes BDJ]